MTDWKWLPRPWQVIVEPYLAGLAPDDRVKAEAALEMLRTDPFNEKWTFPWKGRGGPVQVPRTTRSAILDVDREGVVLEVIYAPYVDYPLLGPIAILELDVESAEEDEPAEE